MIYVQRSMQNHAGGIWGIQQVQDAQGQVSTLPVCGYHALAPRPARLS